MKASYRYYKINKTDQILSETLKNTIENKEDLMQIRAILLEYKNAGGKQENAQEIVEKLRMAFEKNEFFEDKALETLDLIVGWCRLEMRIWEN